MKYIRYIFIIVLVSFCFWYIDDVCALQNLDIFNNLTISDKGMIYNNSNDTSFSQVGYDLDDFILKEGLVVKSISNTSNLQTVANGYGASISQCGLSFRENGYYSMSFYFFDDKYYSHDYSPSFSRKTNKLGISNNLSGLTNFNYDTFDYGTNVYPTTGYQVSYYTVIFKAPSNGTCITSAFSTDTTWTFEKYQLQYLGYTFEYLGDKPLTEKEIQDALSGQFNSVNNKIDDVNSNIDDLKQKQEEQNQTSKGIWATLTDGLGNIGKWFGDLASSIGNFFKDLGSSIAEGFSSLFNSIKSLFVGEEVCDVVEQNLFEGYDVNEIYPDIDGWITLSLTSNGSGKVYASSLKNNFETGKTYNVFVEVDEYSSNSRGFFIPVYETSNQLIGSLSSRINLTDFTLNTNDWIKKENLINFKVSSQNVNTYFLQSSLMNWNNGTSSIKFRMLITDDLSMTVDNYEYYNKKEECTTNGGLFGMLSDFFKSIGDFFGRLFGFIESDDVDSENAGGFFSNFDTEDNGGISSVITAPLVFVRKLTNTCESIKFDVLGANVELPCGDTLFWNKEKVQDLRNLWNIIFSGAFIFILLKKVFKVIENIKDPSSDKVEVMNL